MESFLEMMAGMDSSGTSLQEMQDSLDNVAHDLRTPMTRLRSVAEYGLQAEDDAGDRSRTIR